MTEGKPTSFGQWDVIQFASGRLARSTLSFSKQKTLNPVSYLF